MKVLRQKSLRIDMYSTSWIRSSTAKAINLTKIILPTGSFWDNSLSFISAWNRLGYMPRIDSPRSFNEHILREKKYFGKNLELACKIVDKLHLKCWLARLGHEDLAVPTCGVYDDTRTLSGLMLDGGTILKPTHLSGPIIPIYSSRALTPSELKMVGRWVKTDYYRRSREITYSTLHRRILHEKLMLDDDGDIPMDYKFFCFHGQPFLIQVDLGRFAKHTRQLYSTTWDLHDFGMKFPRNSDSIAKPHQLERALSIAADLSSHFVFCRVDFYFLGNDEIRVGEITFFPESGGGRFTPSEADFRMGEKMRGLARQTEQ